MPEKPPALKGIYLSVVEVKAGSALDDARIGMNIEFRECDWDDLWIWFEFVDPPLEGEQQYLEQVLDSWYSLGLLGGYNASSLPAQEAGVDLSYMDYEPEPNQLPSMMHNMGTVEYEENWARCWFDLGTADAMALDILLNALITLNTEYVSFNRVIVGGVNEDWPVPDRSEMEEMMAADSYSDNHWE
jgi:hypothetical protein